jgi:UDP-N-acetylglucosamine diphosphorylase/glucosamine-1-phosphate N-acetyltransferase
MLHILILAGGMGKRMKSDLPKVCHEYKGKAMINWVLDVADSLGPDTIKIIINPQTEQAIKTVVNRADIEYINQDPPLGTGHAVQVSLESLSDLKGRLLILSGDAPLISQDTLRSLIKNHENSLTLLTAKVPDPTGYGRIVRDSANRFVKIVEHKDCTESQLLIDEVNGGIYLIDLEHIGLVEKIGNDNTQHEYYLTDLLSIFLEHGLTIGVHLIENPKELANVNTRDDLNRL